MAEHPKIVQFCTPSAGVLVALTDTGELWEREIDPRQFAGADGRKMYRWLRIDDPFTVALKEEQKNIEAAKALLKAHGQA